MLFDAPVRDSAVAWLDRHLMYRDADPVAEAAFRERATEITRTAAIVVLAVLPTLLLVWWPTDLLLFEGRPRMVEGFALFRLGAVVLAVLALLALWWVPWARRHPDLVFFAALVLSFPLVVLSLGRPLWTLDEPWFEASYILPFGFAPLAIPPLRRLFLVCAASALWVLAVVVLGGFSPRLAVPLVYLAFATLSAWVIGHYLYDATRARVHGERAIARLLEEKSAFFANISHELRTPLTLLLAALDRLDPERADFDVWVAQAARHASRLAVMVDEFLLFSRLDAGRLELAPRPVDIVALVRGVADYFAAPDRRPIAVDGPEALWAWADPARLTDAVYNLIANAVKFTDPASAEISVAIGAVGDRFRIAIADNGIGIQPNQQQAIFERFRQLDAGSTRKYGGVGIGLALVAEVARLHEGAVEVQSAPGIGSVFTLSIPLVGPKGDLLPGAVEDERAPELRRAVGRALAAPREAPGGVSDGPVVLVVDDDPDMRLHLAEVLQPRYRVVLAADGHEALYQARRHEPEAVVTDLMMPGLDGLDLIAAFRADPATERVPLLVVSAVHDPEARTRALRSRADDYLTKPFHEAELLARVDNLRLQRAQQAEIEHLADGLQERVDAQTRELRGLSRRLVEVHEQQVGQIARELHDEFGQVLTAMRLEVEGLARAVEDRRTAEAVERLERQIDALLRSLRATLEQLRPRYLDDGDLVTALRSLVARLQPAAGAALRLVVDDTPPLPADRALALYRVAQEAMHNAIRHARASAIQVCLEGEDGAISLRIEDDGRGLPEGALSGFGLVGMRERMAAVGGSIAVARRADGGTRVTAQVPA